MREKHRFIVMLAATVALLVALSWTIDALLDRQLEQGLFAESATDKIRLMRRRPEPPLVAAVGDSRVQNHYSTRVFERAGVPFANLGVPQHNVEFAPSRVHAAAGAGAKYILVQITARFLNSEWIVKPGREAFERRAHFLDWWDVMRSQPFEWSMLPMIFSVALNHLPARYALYDKRKRSFGGIPATAEVRQVLTEIRENGVAEDDILYLRGKEDHSRWVAMLRNGDGVVTEHSARAEETWQGRERCGYDALEAKCPDRRFACLEKVLAKCPETCQRCPTTLKGKVSATARKFLRRMADDAASFGSHLVVVLGPKIRHKIILNSENLELLASVAPNVCLIDAGKLVFDASHWADHGHFNSKGRRRFSEIMVRTVQDVIHQGCRGQVFRPKAAPPGETIAGRRQTRVPSSLRVPNPVCDPGYSQLSQSACMR